MQLSLQKESRTKKEQERKRNERKGKKISENHSAAERVFLQRNVASRSLPPSLSRQIVFKERKDDYFLLHAISQIGKRARISKDDNNARRLLSLSHQLFSLSTFALASLATRVKLSTLGKKAETMSRSKLRDNLCAFENLELTMNEHEPTMD